MPSGIGFKVQDKASYFLRLSCLCTPCRPRRSHCNFGCLQDQERRLLVMQACMLVVCSVLLHALSAGKNSCVLSASMAGCSLERRAVWLLPNVHARSDLCMPGGLPLVHEISFPRLACPRYSYWKVGLMKANSSICLSVIENSSPESLFSLEQIVPLFADLLV